MKKFTVLIISALLLQTSFAQVDSVRLQLDKIFQYVDKSQVPTGYLNEYGPEVFNKVSFNGILTDSNSVENIEWLNFMHNDIAESRI